MSDHSSEPSISLHTLGSLMGNQPQRIYSGEQESGSLISSVEQGTSLLSVLPLDLNLVSNELRATPQDATALDTDGESGPIFCCRGKRPHGFHIFLLHIGGGFCILFGCVEIGLGLRLNNYFSNLDTGVWWAGVPVVVAGDLS